MFFDIKALLYKPITPILVTMSLALCFFVQLMIGIGGLWSFKQASIDGTKSLPVQSINTDSLVRAGLKVPLFGDYVPTSLDASGIKQSMLDIRVVGVVFAKDEQASQVLMHLSNGQEAVFVVGDHLPGGIEIIRITQEGVLLRHDGELERLSLPKQALQFLPPENTSNLNAVMEKTF